jgi:DNA-binding transcriptional ArsR family regulator
MSAGDPFEARLLKALGHPLRLRIIESLIETGEGSPVQLARELGQPLATVSHHFRMLRDLGWVELIRTEPRRGAVEHFYRASTRPFIDDEQWVELPVVMRRGLARQTFRRIFEDASVAGGEGGFDEAGAHIDRMFLELDDTGRRELSETLTGVLERADEIQRRSDARAARPAGPDGEVTATSLVILHFRLADRPDAQLARMRLRSGS